MNQEWTLTAIKFSCTQGSFCRRVAGSSEEVIIALCFALTRLHMEYCLSFWAPKSEKKKKNQHARVIPTEAMNMIQGLKHTTYEEMLTEMSLLSLKRKLGGSIVAVYDYLKNRWKKKKPDSS